MTIKSRAIAALKSLPSQGKLLRLSKQVNLAIDSWKLRLEADPTLADVAMEDLLPLVTEFVRTATTMNKIPYTDDLAIQVTHKLMSDER